MISHALLITAFIIAMLGLVYKYLLGPTFLPPLSPIPKAHFTSRFCSIWLWWISDYQGRENRTICALHKRLGPVIQLSPWEISINSVEGLRTIYIGGFSKHEWFREAFTNYGNVPNAACMIHAKEHSARRRILSRVYSKSVLASSEELGNIAQDIIWKRLLPLFEAGDSDHVDVCVKQRKPRHEHSDHERCLNVYPVFESVGMDFVTAYIFGLGNGTNFLSDEKYRDHWLELYTESKDQSVKERAFGGIEQSCLDMCDRAEKTLSTTQDGTNESSDISTRPVVYSQMADGLDAQKKKANDSNDTATNPKRLEIASELLDHMVASHETLGIAMTYMFYELSRNQVLQGKLREELLTLSPTLLRAGGNESFNSRGHQTIPQFRTIDSLPLLNAILQETFRVYAPAPGMLSRVTPFSEKPIVIEGYQIPGGTTVASSAYTLHRNPELFPEPNEWKPERWLDADSDTIDRMRKSFWVFGSGGRMCLGNHFAIQSKLIISTSQPFWSAYRS